MLDLCRQNIKIEMNIKGKVEKILYSKDGRETSNSWLRSGCDE